MARTDRALAEEMGGHYVRRDPRVLCELELIPSSRIQEPRQKLRGKYVVNNSRIAELVWHFTKQNVRRRALGKNFFQKNVVAAIRSISTRTRGMARLHSMWQADFRLICHRNRAVLVDTGVGGMHTNDHETQGNPNTSLDSEPPMALDKFIEQTGLSPVTIWRFRKKRFLQTVNICGRHYVLRSEIARFNSRALAGEFSKPCARPSTASAQH
jgi:hypothetical protein